MRIILLSFLIVFILCIPVHGNAMMLKFNCDASSSSSGSSGTGATCTQIPVPGVALPFQTKTELKICQVRRIFCGEIGTVLIAVAVFMLGIGILNNKVNWPYALIIITGIALFWNANEVTKTIAGYNFLAFSEDPLCSCSCEADLFDPLGTLSGSNLANCAKDMKPVGTLVPQ